jgi:hypothetical protein
MEDLSESVTTTRELVFPDDAAGKKYRIPNLNVYDADEVREELDSDIPQYGKWLPVEIAGATGDGDGFLCAPSHLRSVLVEESIQAGELFRIEKLEKTGLGESDPYKAEVTFPDREADAGMQAGLTD